MKRVLSILSCVVVVVLSAASCNKEEKALSKAYTNELFEQACSCIPWTVLGKDAGGEQPWMQFWSGYLSESTNNQYGKLDTPSQYTLIAQLYQNALRKLDRIIQLNEDPATKETEQVTAFGNSMTQIAVARTLEAYFYMFLTDMIGPIVFTEAFLGDAVENYTPSYMNQQDVYKYLDKVLAEYYSWFLYNLDYPDPVYGGETYQWKKLNASLRMLLAIKLCDVDPATAKSRFAKAYSDGGMLSAEDGFDYDYGKGNDKNLLYYWCSKGHPGSPKNLVPNMLIVNKLQELNDPRAHYYFDFRGYKGERDESYFPVIDNIDFCGAPFGVATNEDAVAFGDYVSCINSKMIAPNAKIPVIPAARVLLAEAEAAYRGWISADAKKLYEAGIKASFAWWGIGDIFAEKYIESHDVIFNSSRALEQIATQRWIASYLSDGVEAWSDWRRLDIPKIPVGPGATAKGVTQYPYRLKFCYDRSSAYTKVSYSDAVNDLRGGSDEVTSRLWWDVVENSKNVLTEEQSKSPVPDWQAVKTGIYNVLASEADYPKITGDKIFGISGFETTLYRDRNHPSAYKLEPFGASGKGKLFLTWHEDSQVFSVPVQSVGFYPLLVKIADHNTYYHINNYSSPYCGAWNDKTGNLEIHVTYLAFNYDISLKSSTEA